MFRLSIPKQKLSLNLNSLQASEVDSTCSGLAFSLRAEKFDKRTFGFTPSPFKGEGWDGGISLTVDANFEVKTL